MFDSAGGGVAFLVAAALVADIIAKACSSPQTTHINAGARADTLMFWVNVGTIEAGVLIAIAAMDKKHRTAIIAGGLFEGIITYGEYLYAKQAGLASNEPGTEDY
jgi:hypothetical protein